MRHVVRWALWIAATCCAACGPETLIEVTIASDLLIPDAVDTLEVTVYDGADLTALDHQSVDLSEHPFPLVVLYEPGDELSRDLRHTVEGRLADAPIATASVEYRWRPGRTNEVAVTLDR